MRHNRPARGAAVRLGAITLVGAALAGAAGAAEAAPDSSGEGQRACTWTVRLLPTVPTTDFAFSDVRGTDGHSTFAGFSNGHAVLWRDGRLIDLGRGGAEDVNRRGDAVGFQADSDHMTHATLFRGGAAIRLAEPAGALATRATGINDAGLIVGTVEFFGGTDPQPTLVWSARTPGKVLDLGTLDGDEANATWLAGVNEQGTLIGNVVNQNMLTPMAVVGTVRGGLRALVGTTADAMTTANGISGRYIAGSEYLPGAGGPVRWVDGRAQILPGGGDARAVNNRGTVVGWRSGNPLLWSGAADPVELPIPAGLRHAGAHAITERGTVAGASVKDSSETLPTLWSCH
jgi:uncharacterized membrane protein